MRRVTGLLAMSVFVGVLAAAARADDEKEEKVPLDKVPKAVLDAVKNKFKDAEIVSAEKEKEDGKTVYEINLKHKGQAVEVSVRPDGKIVSVEKTIGVKDLPKEVAEALESKYPKATIKKVEEVTEDEKVKFEVLLVTADKKKLEVSFDPKGKVLEEEKKDEKKEKKDKD